MAKKNELTAATPSNDLMVPEFMRGMTKDEAGLEDLSRYIIPPRIKIVQPQSGKPFSDQFNVGDVLLVPAMVMVSPAETNEKGKPLEQGTPYHMVPLFFYAEWCCWNPIQLKGTLPAIRERTLNPNSIIAVKSRSSETWFEPVPENKEFNLRYVEHLNFAFTLINHELEGMVIVQSFSRAEHRVGSNLCALIKMRKAPLYGCIFEARSRLRTNQKGLWWGVDITNPSSKDVSPFVQNPDLFKMYREQHEELKAAHKAGILRTDYEDPEEGTVDAGQGQF